MPTKETWKAWDGSQEVSISVERDDAGALISHDWGQDPFSDPSLTDLRRTHSRYFGGGASDAASVTYDDTSTSMGATNVQEAIEALDAVVVDAEDVTYSGTLTSTDVKSALNELAGMSGGTVLAGDVVFDPAQTSLSDTDVQGALESLDVSVSANESAISDLENKVVDASDVTYSGPLTSSDVKSALDELAGETVIAQDVQLTPTGSITSTDVQAAILELDSQVTDAQDVTYSGNLSATNVKDGLDELDVSVTANASSISDLENKVVLAEDVQLTPTGSVVSTDVQSAILELDSQITDASDVTYSGSLAASNVKDGLDELNVSVSDLENAVVDAGDVVFDPASTGLSDTDVQGAIESLDSRVVDAGDVQFTPTSLVPDTNVQDAIESVSSRTVYAQDVSYSGALLATDVKAALDELEGISSQSVVAGDVQLTPTGSITSTDVQSAILELDSKVVDAGDVTHDASQNTLSAADVQSAINALDVKAETPIDASDVQFDNTHSGFSAVDTQAAIDELLDGVADYIESPKWADGISFHTSGTNISSTNVQGAISEIDSRFPLKAAEIEFTPGGFITSPQVQGAITQVRQRVDSNTNALITASDVLDNSFTRHLPLSGKGVATIDGWVVIGKLQFYDYQFRIPSQSTMSMNVKVLASSTAATPKSIVSLFEIDSSGVSTEIGYHDWGSLDPQSFSIEVPQSSTPSMPRDFELRAQVVDGNVGDILIVWSSYLVVVNEGIQ